MKKIKMFMIIIAVVVLVLGIVGCQENKDEESGAVLVNNW